MPLTFRLVKPRYCQQWITLYRLELEINIEENMRIIALGGVEVVVTKIGLCTGNQLIVKEAERNLLISYILSTYNPNDIRLILSIEI